jgi:hypothetical protein
MIAERDKHPVSIYYETDTHWNHLGAGLAFRAFAREIARDAPELRWPDEKTYAISRVDPRIGGDLARFLRIPNVFHDEEPITNAFFLPVQTTRYDYDTGKVVQKGGNLPVDSPLRPLLVRSEGALNSAKVLWLRDSFGQAMSPLMAATFSDVMQLHWDEALKPDLRLARLVEAWKPDYVFITVVERSSRDPKLSTPPPAAGAPAVSRTTGEATDAASVAAAAAPAAAVADVALGATVVATVNAIQHLAADGGEGRYRVQGGDPYVDFAFPTPVDPARTPYLRVSIECDDGSRALPVQIFWLTDGMEYYNEQSSVRMTFDVGTRVFDLRTMSGLARGSAIRRLRLDTDGGAVCARMRLSPPEAGAAR